eukprot:COSAG06_NODE_24605_length_657_cov_2.050179_1_plen_53_part_01
MRCAKMQNVAPCLLIPYDRKMAPCAEWPVAPVEGIGNKVMLFGATFMREQGDF